MATAVIPAVIGRHAEEAAFLWVLRDRAVSQPQFTLRQLAELDQRVEAHLDGLRVAADFGWDLCKKTLEEGGAADLFPAAVLAFDSGQEERARLLLAKGPTAPPRIRALVSALAWLPYAQVKEYIHNLAGADQAPLRRAGIAAAAAHRQHPPFSLSSVLRSSDPFLKARALKAVGEFGATDVLASLKQQLQADNARCRSWASWSGVLVYADPAAHVALQTIAETGRAFAERAADLACRRMEPQQANRWRKRLAELPNKRPAVRVAGAAGDPDAVPWLIERMRVPALARIAGEAFTLVTGADLAEQKLEGNKPEGFEAGPNDNPEDDNVALDPDDNLPWPDAEGVGQWWAKHRAGFAKGKRYLLGKPLGPEAIHHALCIGRQRQRAAAALELALSKRGQPLFEVRAPGFRQQAMLAHNPHP
jgi:uncharacterized protein (TIGR02270 family)